MKLGSLKEGGRDGTLVVVSRDLARAVREGRAAEFAAIAELGETVPDPLAFETFERSRLGWRDDARAREWLELTRRTLAFRAEKVVPLVKSGRRGEARVRRLGPASVAAAIE